MLQVASRRPQTPSAAHANADLAKRQVLLLTKEPLPKVEAGLVDNELVGSAEIDMHGTPIRAYGYLQKVRHP
jgi:hypothetical protein